MVASPPRDQATLPAAVSCLYFPSIRFPLTSMTSPPIQLPSPSDVYVACSLDENHSTLSTNRKSAPSVDSHVDTGSIKDFDNHENNRLRCDQCSITLKETRRMNRHRREVCSGGTKLHCDYASCSVTLKPPRHKAAHVKKQHAEAIADVEEQTEPIRQEDRPGSISPSPSERYESQVFTTGASETSRSPPSLFYFKHSSPPFFPIYMGTYNQCL
jgi:hypothetical protein